MFNALLRSALAIILVAACGRSQARTPAGAPPNMAIRNGLWFNGRSFEPRTVYSVQGRFALTKPARLDCDLDLAGAWIVPPFGEGHNYNIGTGVEEWDTRAIAKYQADGVFYVKIQGNLPLIDKAKQSLGVGTATGIDSVFAQGSITARGGHPIALVADSSAGEMEYLRSLGVFDSPTLLRMWTEATSQRTFPARLIGELRERFEASFLALEGDPLKDWRNLRKIKLRFKQGYPLGKEGAEPRRE